ncbi:hypothetical protein V5O48_003503 [Marasmius crinis-equi]|uniref:Uncharacterized protein n=1 Tax=Marasmius crinis-equi TaxID=585013 RepID=A0ABR3FTS2_9AGAR
MKFDRGVKVNMGGVGSLADAGTRQQADTPCARSQRAGSLKSKRIARAQTRFRSLRRGSRSALESVPESKGSADTSDWVDVTHAELPVKLDDPVWHQHPSLSLNTSLTGTAADRTDARSISESLTLTLRPDHPEAPYNHPQHVRSRPSLGLWKNLSKVSLQSPQSLRNRFSKSIRRNSKREDTRSILDDFPTPPSHLPTPVSPPSAGPSVSVPWPSKEETHNRSSSVASTSTNNHKATARDAKKPLDTIPSTKSHSNPLKSLTKVFTSFTSRHHHQHSHPEVPAVPPLPPLPPSSQRKAVETEPEPEPEPVESSQEAQAEETPAEVVTETSTEDSTTPTNPVAYEFVDPSKLCCDPSPLIGGELFGGSARSSFVPPSPSWLSRNVPQLEVSDSVTQNTPGSEGLITPPSPAPLPIPPRIVISSCPQATNTPPLSPLEAADFWLKRLDTAAPSRRHSRISNISNLSRKSSAASISGLFSSTDHRSDSKNATLTPVLLFTSPSPEQTPPSPPAIPLSSSSFGFAEHDLLQTPTFETPSSTFDPRGDLEATSPPYTSAQPALSSNLLNLLSVICAEARITMEEHGGNDTWGKRTDVVDFGGEVDYSGMQWFTEPPPEQAVPKPQQQQLQAYDPEPVVVQQNEHFGYALSASPNVLYGRWKQYGQLGVLGWCSEFAELIDNLKDLGIQGNMFLETRKKALEACRDIMKLKMDIRMQIVVMYLSAQVQRLRRFLDPDNVYDDYPEPAFPLDPYQHR